MPNCTSTWRDSDRVSLTPLGLAALTDSEAPAPDTCPRCGSPLGVVHLYVGGRGHLPYNICQNPNGCDYQRRA